MEPVTVATLDDAANAVHRALGPGLSEVVYQTALAMDLRKRGCMVETEVVIPIFYQKTYVGFVRADLVVNQCMVIEVKAVAKITEAHMLQLQNYMRWLSLDRMLNPPSDGTQGAVINFGGKAVATIGTVMGADAATLAAVHVDNQA
jgi:GxxExxY protein